MTDRAPGLGRRLGRVFLLQATLISLAAIIGVYAAGTTIEEVLIRRALEEEADHFWRRFSASPHFPVPDTRNLTGHLARGADRGGVPAPVAELGPGFHDLDTAADFSVVYVTERDGDTLFLVFDGERVSDLALWFGLVPLAGALVILYLSSWFAYRLATRAVSPVIWLAGQVRRLDPRAPDASAFTPERLPAGSDREILALTEALRGLSRNVHEHIERERDFSRDASHELRTPLTVVRLAAAELRRRPRLDAKSRETVARIERAVRDMEETTEALLLLARASESNLIATEVRLDDIVARECEHARAAAGSKPVCIEEGGVMPVIVDAHARVLAVLVGNLLRNAVQYTGDGRVEGGMAAVAGVLARLGELARRNTRAGARRNIGAHYDLGNDFFALFLDETLTYSAGIFESANATMADASRAKLDRICRKLALSPGDRVVEIGSGWGSFAVHAASRYGCRVTTTTISREQHAFVERLVREHDLADRVKVLCSDYRDLRGTFDKLVSIEMIEAVGHRHLPRYFGVCADLLHERGEALIQAITMPERRYRQYRRRSDFIRRHVFPGSCVPSLGAILAAASGAAGFSPVHLEDIGPHYAETLRRWRAAFEARLDAVRGLGFDERFIRLWRFYLAYCEAGFEERYLGDAQLLLRKSGCRRAPVLGRFG